MKFIKREWMWLLGLVLLVGLVWAVHYDRLSPDSWAIPPEQGGDAAVSLSLIKTAADGNSPPFLAKTVTRLGAPFQANWDDFPLPEEIIIFLLGIVAKWFGLFKASNFAVIMVHISSALTFYCCCRFLRFRREWSLMGAVLFAFTHYYIWRGLAHLLIAYGYTVPFAILSCWLIGGSKGIRWGDRRFWLCAISSVVLGLGNPYNLNLYVQLLCLAIVFQLFTRRRKLNLKIGLLCLGLAAVAFVCINLDTLIFNWTQGKNGEAISRNYFESELYALKPMELMVPPSIHRIGFLADIGRKYAASSYLRGEIFSAYLGIVGIGGLIWMIIESLGWVFKRRCPQRFPAYILQILWTFLYSIIGGLNCLVALGGLVLFRSSNRFSLFISALVLLFVVSRLSHLSRKWQPMWRWGLAGLMVIIGLTDQVPAKLMRDGNDRDDKLTAKYLKNDRLFTTTMEEQLPHDGMVFQLPVIEYPGGGGVHNASEYELFRPYLHSKSLRFSFGNIKGRPRDSWQREVEKMPVTQMAATLERYGFSAIYICRKGFPDNGEALLKQLSGAGKDQIIEDELKEQVCVLLKPSPNPELPGSVSQAMVVYDAGWSVVEQTPTGKRRWSSGNATLEFFNPYKAKNVYSIKCQIGSPTARQVVMILNDKEIWRANLGAGQMSAVDVAVDARKGYNGIQLLTDSVPVQASPNSNRMIAFAVADLTITRLSSNK